MGADRPLRRGHRHPEICIALDCTTHSCAGRVKHLSAALAMRGCKKTACFLAGKTKAAPAGAAVKPRLRSLFQGRVAQAEMVGDAGADSIFRHSNRFRNTRIARKGKPIVAVVVVTVFDPRGE